MDRKKLDDTQYLELLLEKIDGDAGEEMLNAAKFEQDDIQMLNRLRSLCLSMKDDCSGEDSHFTLSELKQLVRDRKVLNEQWEMPDHLADCSCCLEAFQILLEGVPDIDTQTFHCFVDDTVTRGFSTYTFANMKSRPSSKRKRTWKYLAVLCLITILGMVAFYLLMAPDWRVSVRDGALRCPGIPQLPGKFKIPGSTRITAAGAPVNIILEDRYQLKLEQDSVLVLGRRSIFSDIAAVTVENGGFTLTSFTSVPVGVKLKLVFPMATLLTDDAKMEVLYPFHSSVSGVKHNSDNAGNKVPPDSVRIKMVAGRAEISRGGETVTVSTGQTVTVNADKIVVASGNNGG